MGDNRTPDSARLFASLQGKREQFLAKIKEKQDLLKELVLGLESENSEIRLENERLRAANCSMRGEEFVPLVPEGYIKHKGGADDPKSTYRLAKILRTHEAPVHSATCVSGKGGRLATASWDATVQIYDLEREDNDAVVRTLGGEQECDDGFTPKMGGLYDVAFSERQPQILGCASADKFVYVWNWEANRLLAKLGGHTDEVNGVAFHATQQVMATASDDHTAIIWDYREGIKLRTLADHTKAVYGASFLGSTGELQYCLATSSFDKRVRIYDMRSKAVVETLAWHGDDVVGLDFCECDGGGLLASGSDDGCFCVFDTRDWSRPLYKVNTRQNPGVYANEVKRVRFNRDGTKLAVGNSSNQVLVFDLKCSPPRILGQLEGHTDCVFDCCFGVDSLGVEYLVDTSHDWTCYVWRQVQGA